MPMSVACSPPSWESMERPLSNISAHHYLLGWIFAWIYCRSKDVEPHESIFHRSYNMHNIIQIHNSVLQDWQYFVKYSSHSVWMCRIFIIILSIVQNNIMNLNNLCAWKRLFVGFVNVGKCWWWWVWLKDFLFNKVKMNTFEYLKYRLEISITDL